MKAVLNMEELLVRATPGQVGRPTGKSCICFGTVNVGTISSRANEIVKILTLQKVDLCCFQETRWRRGLACLIKGNNAIYKFFWWGDQSGFGGVEMLAEKWVNNIISLKRYDHRYVTLRFLVGKTMLYAAMFPNLVWLLRRRIHSMKKYLV